MARIVNIFNGLVFKENISWKEIKCDVCMNKAQESNKFGGVAAETTFFL